MSAIERYSSSLLGAIVHTVAGLSAIAFVFVLVAVAAFLAPTLMGNLGLNALVSGGTVAENVTQFKSETFVSLPILALALVTTGLIFVGGKRAGTKLYAIGSTEPNVGGPVAEASGGGQGPDSSPGERYEFAFFNGGVDVHTDDSGNRYVKRGKLRRAMWMGFGLFFAGLVAFMLLVETGPMTILFWGGGILAVLAGVVGEPIVGTDRSEVTETEEGVYVELIPVTRGMAGGATLMATWMGLSLIFELVNPSGAAQYARTKGWILVLADVIPFGELILGGVILLIAYGLFEITRSGYTEIEPASE